MNDLIKKITKVIKIADINFTKKLNFRKNVGTTEQWVSKCLIPELLKENLAIINAKPLKKVHGLNFNDSIPDALKRADHLSQPDSFSGLLVTNKDLRRLVLLANEYKKSIIQKKNTEKQKKN